MREKLLVKEIEKLRDFYWKMVEAQGEFRRAVDDIARAHKLPIETEKWSLTPDFNGFEKQ